MTRRHKHGSVVRHRRSFCAALLVFTLLRRVTRSVADVAAAHRRSQRPAARRSISTATGISVVTTGIIGCPPTR